jgi:hypothetical protein
MLKLSVITGCLLFASGTQAGDVKALMERYYEDRPVCRSIEETTSEEQAMAACESMETIAKVLTADGYCWDKAELIWDECPMSN